MRNNKTPIVRAARGNGVARKQTTAAESKRTRTVAAPLAEVIGFDYDFGRTAADAIRLFSDAVVFKLFKSAAQQQLSDFIRQCRAGTKQRPAMSDKQLKAAVRDWSPELKRRGKSPVVKASKFIGKMTEDEKAEMRRLLDEGEGSGGFGATNGKGHAVVAGSNDENVEDVGERDDAVNLVENHDTHVA
jgi:hypothetical protein